MGADEPMSETPRAYLVACGVPSGGSSYADLRQWFDDNGAIPVTDLGWVIASNLSADALLRAMASIAKPEDSFFIAEITTAGWEARNIRKSARELVDLTRRHVRIP